MALAEEIRAHDLINPYADIIIESIKSAWGSGLVVHFLENGLREEELRLFGKQ